MDESEIKKISNDVTKFSKKVNNINLNDDPFQLKSEIEDLEGQYNELNSNIEEGDNDLKESSDSNTKPLINKLSQIRTDLEIAKNKLNEKKNSWKNKYNLELLQSNELTGYEKVKAERDVIFDQHKDADFQGDMIKDIGNNIKGANNNLVGINADLKQQGEKITNVGQTTSNITGKVGQTERIMTKMERRQTCAKVIGAIGIVVIGLADIALLIAKLVGRSSD